MEFQSGETSFGGLISSGRFLPVHLLEKACNFDTVRELLNKVLTREPLCSLIDLQDVVGIEIKVGWFDSVQKRLYNIDINRNRCDFKLFRLLHRKLPVG